MSTWSRFHTEAPRKPPRVFTPDTSTLNRDGNHLVVSPGSSGDPVSMTTSPSNSSTSSGGTTSIPSTGSSGPGGMSTTSVSSPDSSDAPCRSKSVEYKSYDEERWYPTETKYKKQVRIQDSNGEAKYTRFSLEFSDSKEEMASEDDSANFNKKGDQTDYRISDSCEGEFILKKGVKKSAAGGESVHQQDLPGSPFKECGREGGDPRIEHLRSKPNKERKFFSSPLLRRRRKSDNQSSKESPVPSRKSFDPRSPFVQRKHLPQESRKGSPLSFLFRSRSSTSPAKTNKDASQSDTEGSTSRPASSANSPSIDSTRAKGLLWQRVKDPSPKLVSEAEKLNAANCNTERWVRSDVDNRTLRGLKSDSWNSKILPDNRQFYSPETFRRSLPLSTLPYQRNSLNITDTANLVSSLDKSILQIRDWLTLLEDMLNKDEVNIFDHREVQMQLQRHKNVLRELEQKKPQLDELVRTADSLRDSPIKQQIPAKVDVPAFSPEHNLYHIRICLKVTQLREHWEDTSQKVLARKSQLEELEATTTEIDRKQREIDAGLARLEGWRGRILDKSRNPSAEPHIPGQTLDEFQSFREEVDDYQGRMNDYNTFVQTFTSNLSDEESCSVQTMADSFNKRYSLLCSLTEAPSSIQSVYENLENFHNWISTIESRVQVAEDCRDNLNEVQQLEKIEDLQEEMERHKEMFLSLDKTGRQLVSGLTSQEDASLLHRRLEEMNQRWNYLKAKSMAIRSRLENTNEDWSALLISLRELVDWVVKKEHVLINMGQVGGDEATIRKQQEETRSLKRQLYDKRPVIENKLLSGRQFLSSEPTPSDTSDSDMSRETESDTKSDDLTKDQLNKSIRREVAKLSDKWSSLLSQVDYWSRKLDETLPRVHTFQAGIEAVISQLCAAEQAQKNLVGTTAADPETMRTKLKNFSSTLVPLQRVVEDINDQASDFTANNIFLSRHVLSRLEDINTRWKLVQLGMDDQYKKLNEVKGKDRVPNTQDFLSVGVSQPWTRSISNNGVPYYINHQTETTHWDHPEMVNIFKSLIQFNTIRFSAYRTSMKLRELQKRLSLHLLPLNVAVEAFDAHGLRGQNDRTLDVSDMVSILATFYETISAGNPTSVNVPLCLDLTLNWLLNLYDCQRCGQVRVLSFKVALVILCKGQLDEKYRYMFRLISDQQRRSSQKKLAQLLSDCIQVPRVLGEISAFGGVNVEPSVRSCFEQSGDKGYIEALNFLNWMKQEPQSMVWLPVLHRFSAAEAACHQAKCNICKQSPILGFRYRCLKCFNFDMCQECFFAGKGGRYKNHKMTHPMQEYCTTTTSGEDMRDFTKLLRNKLLSKKKKNSRLGYLPVQSVDNDPPESPSVSPARYRQEILDRLDVLPQHVPDSDVRSGSDESSSQQVTPLQHPEPTRVSGGSTLVQDEHSLIAVYCKRISDGNVLDLIPDSPMQVAADIDEDQRQELEHMIRTLEAENATLKEEYNNLQVVGTSQAGFEPNCNQSDADILAEAAMLREHRNRLESRMVILEEHNRQLENQLGKLKQILEPGSNPANRTGTLTTKAVTASLLATDSPVLPHKLNGGYVPPPEVKQNGKIPPLVPARRDSSGGRQNGAAVSTLKRSSAGQNALDDVFRASTLSRRDNRDGRVPFRREASVPRGSGNWSDSLPRKDMFASQTGSLPRRDKAGLGRPEPTSSVESSAFNRGQSVQEAAGPTPVPEDPQETRDGSEALGLEKNVNLGKESTATKDPAQDHALGRQASKDPEKDSLPSRQPIKDLTLGRKEPSISRDNPFRDAILGLDKRSSTGNIFFTDQFDNHPWENPELNFQGTTRRRNNSNVSSTSKEGEETSFTRDPAATLQAMAGNVGKELNQLISLMNQEEDDSKKTESSK